MQGTLKGADICTVNWQRAKLVLNLRLTFALGSEGP